MSEDSFLHAWPASARLERALRERRADRIQYTLPGVKQELDTEPITSSAQIIIDDYLTSLDDNNCECIRKLVDGGFLSTALSMTTDLLTKLGQGMGTVGTPTKNTSTSFKIWSNRFQLMLILKKHSQLIEEMAPFEELDAPDLYLEYHSEHAAQKGSMIPFSMRLVHAEILRFTPMPWKAYERVRRLEVNTKKVLKQMMDNSNAAGIATWKRRERAVLMLKCRTLFHLDEYSTAMEIARHLIDSAEDAEGKAEAGRAAVRMAVAAGDERALETLLAETAALSSTSLLLHKAFRAMFHGSYPHAIEYLQRAIDSGDVSSEVANALAVCHLYVGDPEKGLAVLLECTSLSPTMRTNATTLAEVSCAGARKAEVAKRIDAEARNAQ